MMSEREIKQLMGLLGKFESSSEKDGGGNMQLMDARIRSIIMQVRTWVRWYGRDELGMDL